MLGAVLACIAAMLANTPSDQPRMLLAGLAVPLALLIWRPALSDLSHRLSEPDTARLVALSLESGGLQLLLRCCWLLASAGVVAVLVLDLSRLAAAHLPGFASQSLMPDWHGLAGGNTFSAIGLAVGLAGFALPRRVGRARGGDRLDVAALLFALGAGLLLAVATPPEQAADLAMATALVGANVLPALLAMIALPWLNGRLLSAGLITGCVLSLLGAASGLLDGPSAALAGVLANLLVAVMPTRPLPAHTIEMRARLHRTLAGPFQDSRVQAAWATGVVWVFLTLGPGWPLICRLAGEPWRAAAIAAASAPLLWQLLRTGRASSPCHRASRDPRSRRTLRLRR